MSCDRTTLYRSFDEHGALLYVGISHSAMHRLSQHKATSIWHNQCVHVELEHFDSRQEALEAEDNAIKTELPMFNIKGKVNQKKKSNDSFYDDNGGNIFGNSLDELFKRCELEATAREEREKQLELVKELKHKLALAEWNLKKAEKKYIERNSERKLHHDVNDMTAEIISRHKLVKDLGGHRYRPWPHSAPWEDYRDDELNPWAEYKKPSTCILSNEK
tara:strand:- start:4092 stop:4745 length:654 start_codon:yes stop_codon:yes gene_type:complete